MLGIEMPAFVNYRNESFDVLTIKHLTSSAAPNVIDENR